MKMHMILSTGAALVAAAISIFVYVENGKNSIDEFFNANIEALADSETDNTCDIGICGKCFEEVKAWPFYKCNWTGNPSDHCDCDKPGWIY